MFAKHAYGKPYRGFESLFLRLINQMKPRNSGVFLFSEKAKSLLLKLCMKIKNSAALHLILTYEDGGINERSELIPYTFFKRITKIKNTRRVASLLCRPAPFGINERSELISSTTLNKKYPQDCFASVQTFPCGIENRSV